MIAKTWSGQWWKTGTGGTVWNGITFDEAVADGANFDLDGHAIPVIGRAALLKNKMAAGREQDLADVKALERKK